MPTTKEKAMEFVNERIGVGGAKLKEYLTYAANNFIQFHTDPAIAPSIDPALEQLGWARFLQYNVKKMSGDSGSCAATDIYYTSGATRPDAPTLVAKGTQGAHTGKFTGHGHCAFFSEKCTALLTAPVVGKKWAAGAPIVQTVFTKLPKPGTPGHTWVLVNGDAAKTEWVVVDLWLHLLGVPLAQSICLGSNAGVRFLDGKFTAKATWNPYPG